MIKKYWWVIGIGIVLLLVLFWPRNQKIEKDNPEPVKAREDLNLPVDLPKVKSVNWGTINNINLPKISRILVQKQIIDDAKEIKIKSILGIEGTNGFVDKNNNIVEYTEEIKGLDQLPQTGEWDIEILRDKLRKIVETINSASDLEIKWTDVKYQKILYPRWIDSTENESQSVQISGDYVVDGIRMTTYYGESIRGTFNREGRLIKMNLTLKPIVLSKEGNLELINIDEVNKSSIGMYGVVKNAGIELIDEVNITQVEIVEVYDNKKNIINPYYWLEGNTYSNSQPFRISLLLKAEK